MRRNAAHRMEAYRAADHLIMCLTAEISPFLRQPDFLFKGNAGQFSGDGANLLCRHSALICHCLWCIAGIQILFSHMLEDCAMCAALICDAGRQIRTHARRIIGHQLAGLAAAYQQLAIIIPHQQTMISLPRRINHQSGRVGIAAQIIQIDLTRFQKTMDQRENKQAICARGNTHPIIRHRIITRANRIYANHPRTARF